MAAYRLTRGMLPTSAATAFSMVFVTNGIIGNTGTPRWKPLPEPFCELEPSGGPSTETSSSAGNPC